jgi:hypothetical protein
MTKEVGPALYTLNATRTIRLLYRGHYVAHDNNRDAMGMTLDLTRNILNTYVEKRRPAGRRFLFAVQTTPYCSLWVDQRRPKETVGR